MKRLKTKEIIFYSTFLFFFMQTAQSSHPEIQTHSWKTSLLIGAVSLATGAFLHRLYVQYWDKKEVASPNFFERESQKNDLPLQADSEECSVSRLIEQYEVFTGKEVVTLKNKPKLETSTCRNSGVEFGQEILIRVLKFSRKSTEGLELDPKYLVRLANDTVIQRYFQQLNQNREKCFNKQGEIFGKLSRHVRNNYFRGPVAASRKGRLNVGEITFGNDT